MRILLVLATAAACSQPAPIVAPPVKRPPIVATASCADAGTLLRGEVHDEQVAGPAKEAAIARTCVAQRWPASVLACITRQPEPTDCLDALAEPQHEAYEAALETWREAHPGGDDDEDDEIDEDDDDELDPDVAVSCADAIHHVETWPPPSTVTGEDLVLSSRLRQQALERVCEGDGWDGSVSRCLQSGQPGAVTACLGQLDADEQQHVTDGLKTSDRLVGKIAGLRKRPASITCKQVTARHYAARKWNKEITEIKGSARRKLIAESRNRMTKVCTDAGWSLEGRACLVADGDAACFDLIGEPSHRWGYPAAGVMFKTGVPECDQYGEQIGKLAACGSLPKQARDAILDGFSMAARAWLTVPADQRASVAEACKAASSAMTQAASSMGC